MITGVLGCDAVYIPENGNINVTVRTSYILRSYCFNSLRT